MTTIKLKAAEDDGKLAALSRAQAVIEFTPSGEIVTANEIFLTTLGYRIDEIVGRHHAMFCDPTYAAGPEYQRFWQELAAGRHQTAEFQGVAKGGRKEHIQASYNPILDMNGDVFKVVKFATDVTGRVENVIELARELRKLSDGYLNHSIEQQFIPLKHSAVEIHPLVPIIVKQLVAVARCGGSIPETKLVTAARICV